MKRTIKFIAVVIFALFFNTKAEAQIDSITTVGGWKIIAHKNVSSAIIFQDTTKGHDLGSRGYVEGKGALRLQFVSSKPRTSEAQAYVVIGKSVKEFQFPLKIGFVYKFGYLGPRFPEYPVYAQYHITLIGKSGIRYPYLEQWIGSLGFVENGTWTGDTPTFASMLDGRDSLPTESIVGIEIETHINADSVDMALDWLAIKYAAVPGNGITIDSFEDSTVVGVEDEPSVPTEFSLSQNYPNPFNPSTTIQYKLSKSEFVSLKVFDVLGREIETLVNEEKSVGEYTVNFNGSSLTSGTYFYRLDIGHNQFSETKKMILVK